MVGICCFCVLIAFIGGYFGGKMMKGASGSNEKRDKGYQSVVDDLKHNFKI